MDQSRVIQEIMGLKEPDLYSNNHIKRLSLLTGTHHILQNNMRNCIKEVSRAYTLINAKKKFVKLPQYSLHFADIGDIQGCYIYPHDMIVLNIWSVFSTPLYILCNTIPHELTHMYGMRCGKCGHHGKNFDNIFKYLFDRSEVKDINSSTRSAAISSMLSKLTNSFMSDIICIKD